MRLEIWDVINLFLEYKEVREKVETEVLCGPTMGGRIEEYEIGKIHGTLER